MNISGATSLNYIVNKFNTKSISAQLDVSTKAKGDTVVQVSDSAKKMLQTEEISKKYDLTNISYNEKEKMAQDLYENGDISLFEQGLMTADKMLSETFNTNHDENRKMNFLASFSSHTDYMKSLPTTSADEAKLYEGFTEKLEYFNRLRTGKEF